MYNLGAFRYESVYMGIAAFYHAICTAPDHNTAVSRPRSLAAIWPAFF